MVEIVLKDERSLTDAGNSRRVSISEEWIQLLGLEDEDSVVTAVLYSEKHGLHFGAWKEGEQPEFENVPEEVAEEMRDAAGGN